MVQILYKYVVMSLDVMNTMCPEIDNRKIFENI